MIKNLDGLFSIFTGISSMTSAQYISSLEAKTLYNQEILFVDIRPPEEFQKFNIPNSINIPLTQIIQLQNISSKTIVILCRSGVRTHNHQSIFENYFSGTQLFILEHGILEWMEKGFLIHPTD